MTYFQYNILPCISSFCFSLSVLVKLLKHVKLIFFRVIMNAKKTSVFDKSNTI